MTAPRRLPARADQYATCRIRRFDLALRLRLSDSEQGIGSKVDTEFSLEAGDSFGCPSTLPHRYRNPGVEEAEVIWAITPSGSLRTEEV